MKRHEPSLSVNMRCSTRDMLQKAGSKDDYELIDSGDGRKYERFGSYRLIRPCGQAIWRPQKGPSVWKEADASFDRLEGNRWQLNAPIPDNWHVTVSGMQFRLSTTDFGHLGIFPEQRDLWSWITFMLEKARDMTGKEISVLNLFAYSGGSTLASARSGAQVRHVDASKGMVKWARENAEINGLGNAPIHWIVEDVNRFLDREIRRSRRYDAVILDPPTFGHGRRKEIYKIDEELSPTLEKCRALLSDTPVFILLSSHTPHCTPIALTNFLRSITKDLAGSCIEYGEMLLTGAPDVLPVPSGTYARWFPEPYTKENPS
jgi:23S rRNA (cytosine1962-C5)-methyltransferase